MTITIAAALLFAPQPDTPAIQKWVKQLRPNVTYSQEVDSNAPLVTHTLRFKYPSPDVRFETHLAKDTIYSADRSSSRETVDKTAARLGAFAAINADFFAWDGDPLGIQIASGEFISEPFSPRAAVAWSDSALMFDSPKWQAQLILDAENITINGLDRSARTGEIVANTPKAGVASSKEQCYAFVFECLETASAGKNLTVRFKNVFPDLTDMPVGKDEIVFMATKNRAPALLGKLQQDRTYVFRIELSGEINWNSIKEAIGGGPRLVKNGKPFIPYDFEKFDANMTKRHPRTAIGYTSSGEVVLCVVDGRSKISRGATFEEMADIMLKQGCTDAINLDGGGSSTMVIGGSIVNRPSDGVARPVANALLLYLSEANPPPPIQLKISPQPSLLKPGDVATFKLSDSDGNPIPNSEVLWTSYSGAGWIDEGGTFRALAAGKAIVRALTAKGRATIDLQIANPPDKKS